MYVYIYIYIHTDIHSSYIYIYIHIWYDTLCYTILYCITLSIMHVPTPLPPFRRTLSCLLNAFLMYDPVPESEPLLPALCEMDVRRERPVVGSDILQSESCVNFRNCHLACFLTSATEWGERTYLCGHFPRAMTKVLNTVIIVVVTIVSTARFRCHRAQTKQGCWIPQHELTEPRASAMYVLPHFPDGHASHKRRYLRCTPFKRV